MNDYVAGLALVCLAVIAVVALQVPGQQALQIAAGAAGAIGGALAMRAPKEKLPPAYVVEEGR